MKVYFDQNVLQYIIERIPVYEFKQKLGVKQIEICLGLHNTYEFSRCFIDEKNLENIEKGKIIFKYLGDIDIEYFLIPTKDLIDSDLVYARTGGKLLPYLDEYNKVAEKEEIIRLSNGWYDRAKKFIQEREKNHAEDVLQYRIDIIKQNPNQRPRNFEEFRDTCIHRRSILDNSEFKEKAEYLSDSKLFSEPEKYPYLNTFINAQIYFNFIALTNPEGPSGRLTSDYRHLIDANSADYFVTADDALLRSSQKICPYVNTYAWNKFEDEIISE